MSEKISIIIPVLNEAKIFGEDALPLSIRIGTP